MESVLTCPRAGPRRHSMTLTMPPVWRSQLTTHNPSYGTSQLEHVKMRLSGEKTSTLNAMGMPCGDSRVWSRLRVAGSSISTVLAPLQVIAMNLLHGDHATLSTTEGCVVATVLAFHDIGPPPTILTKGWACDSYSFRTIEFFGATTSAE